MLGNKDLAMVLCFSTAWHTVLSMSTWNFIKSPDLVSIFWCIWNSHFSFCVGSKMQTNLWHLSSQGKHRATQTQAGQPEVPPSGCASSQGKERLIPLPGCLVLPPAPVSSAVKLRCSWQQLNCDYLGMFVSLVKHERKEEGFISDITLDWFSSSPELPQCFLLLLSICGVWGAA